MDDKQASLSDSLKWIRAYRKASSLELSPSILDYMKSELLNKLGDYIPKPESEPRVKSPTKTNKSKSREQVELELRKLIKTNADWQAIATRAWELFHHHPTGKTGANLIEIAFLYGGLDEACGVLEKLLGSNTKKIYEKIHPAVRAQMLSYMWSHHKSGKVWVYLADNQHQSWLQAFEKLLLFVYLNKEEQASLCWLFFRTHQKSIETGIKEIGQQIGLSLHSVQFLAARQAIRLGRVEEGSRLIKAIPPVAAEYKEGLKLLHSLGTHQDFFKNSTFYSRLSGASSWQAKLNLFESFLEQIRTAEPAHAKDLLALNALLNNPLEWLPEDGIAWEQLSKLLIRYAELSKLLPNLSRVFCDNTFKLRPMELDLALWRPLSVYKGKQDELVPLAAIAKVHCFLSTLQEFNEDMLFNARQELLKLHEESSNKPQGFQLWSSMWEWLHDCIETCQDLSPSKKQKLSKLVQACKHPLNLSCDEITSYLEAPYTKPPSHALTEFQQIAQDKKAHELELLCLLKNKSSHNHFTNKELERLWHLSVKRNKSDLAWRSISVLQNRCSVPEPIKIAWEISGEHKKQYPCIEPNPRQIDKCLIGFQTEEVRLIWACLKLGVQVPILLSHIDKMIQIDKFSFNHFRLKESGKINQALESIKWLATPKRDYSFAGQASSKGFATPAFGEIVLPNPWNHLVAIICHRMGMASWKWRLSNISQAIKELKPKPSQGWQPFAKEHSLGKWIKTLEPEQRSAWQDLSHICQRLSDEQGFRAISCFVVRLATLIHQSHYLAIYSLKKMRAPIYLIWDLEAWILSPEYSKLRLDRQWQHELSIPHSLQQDTLLG
ncbi:MAG: hypothetical protein HRU09_00270 [Oligoflexales bacterium]|nr:hypothetical protein [Oligoflexales bacterium]